MRRCGAVPFLSAPVHAVKHSDHGGVVSARGQVAIPLGFLQAVELDVGTMEKLVLDRSDDVEEDGVREAEHGLRAALFVEVGGWLKIEPTRFVQLEALM